MVEDVALQPGKSFQEQFGAVFRFASVVQIGGNIHRIGKYSLLTHTPNYRHDLLLAQSEDVC